MLLYGVVQVEQGKAVMGTAGLVKRTWSLRQVCCRVRAVIRKVAGSRAFLLPCCCCCCCCRSAYRAVWCLWREFSFLPSSDLRLTGGNQIHITTSQDSGRPILWSKTALVVPPWNEIEKGPVSGFQTRPVYFHTADLQPFFFFLMLCRGTLAEPV